MAPLKAENGRDSYMSVARKNFCGPTEQCSSAPDLVSSNHFDQMSSLLTNPQSNMVAVNLISQLSNRPTSIAPGVR